MLAEGKRWFDRFLRGSAERESSATRPVTLATRGQGDDALVRARCPRPAAPAELIALPAQATIGQAEVDEDDRACGGVETFGSPIVRVTATATGGWSRLVAVLSARRPRVSEIVVSARRRAAQAGHSHLCDRV